MEKTIKDKPCNIKTVFLGDAAVGKTSLLQRQVHEKFSTERYLTIVCDFLIKTYSVGQIETKMHYWDTAGQQRFRTITRSYYRDAYAVIICFDLGKRQSFENLPSWIELISHQPGQYRQTFLIGCKSDLGMEVTAQQIINFAEKNQLIYFQTSAKTGEGVRDAFNHIARLATQKYIEKRKLNPQGITKDNQNQLTQVQRGKGCCY